MSSLLDRISELEQQIATLKAEVEREEKEKDPNKRWRADESCLYWFVQSNGNPYCVYEYNRDIDNFRYDTHNYFQTEEEARRYASVLETERQLKKFADEHNDVIDWTNINQEKYYLCYSYSDYRATIADRHWTKESRTIYFSSEKIAKQVIDEIGIDKIKEYLTYEW